MGRSPLGDLAPTHQGADEWLSFAGHRFSSSLSSSRTPYTLHYRQTCCPQRLPKTERRAPSPAPLWLWRSRTRRMGPLTTGHWRNSGVAGGWWGRWGRWGCLPGQNQVWVLTSVGINAIVFQDKKNQAGRIQSQGIHILPGSGQSWKVNSAFLGKRVT